jgi:hypothetical protein
MKGLCCRLSRIYFRIIRLTGITTRPHESFKSGNYSLRVNPLIQPTVKNRLERLLLLLFNAKAALADIAVSSPLQSTSTGAFATTSWKCYRRRS